MSPKIGSHNTQSTVPVEILLPLAADACRKCAMNYSQYLSEGMQLNSRLLLPTLAVVRSVARSSQILTLYLVIAANLCGTAQRVRCARDRVLKS
jgi:hypothetical protein